MDHSAIGRRQVGTIGRHHVWRRKYIEDAFAAQPTALLCDWTDGFDSFDENVWSSQCAGCSYAGGDLSVAGNNMWQVTNHRCAGISSIKGTLTKDEYCDDHLIMLSTSATIRHFNWNSVSGVVVFIWDCDYKVIYGQSNSISEECSTFTTYNIEITVSNSSVTFYDDVCGTLSLDDTIGSSRLYVYVGSE